MKPINLSEFIIAVATLCLMWWFVWWADHKKRRDEKKYPSADVKRLDDFEEKIS